VVNADGSLARGGAGVKVTHLGTGQYEVTFASDVSSCAYTATIGDTDHQIAVVPGMIYTAGGHASGGGDDHHGVYVETVNINGIAQDLPFHLNVNCTSLFAVVKQDGSIQRSSSNVSVFKFSGNGKYEVRFNQSVSQCAYTATIGDPGYGSITGQMLIFTASGQNNSPNEVYVETKNYGGGLTDFPFHLSVNCGLYALVNVNGSLARASSGVSSAQYGTPGTFEVTFNQDVSGCAYTVTIGSASTAIVTGPGLVYANGGRTSGGSPDNHGVYIETKNTAGGLGAAWPFHLSVFCPPA
jgi:hypothetical protein